MNNTFNILRCGRLFKKHLTEHARAYTLSCVLLFGIMFVFYGFMLSNSLHSIFVHSGMQELVFGACLYLSSVAFTTSFYTFFMYPAKSTQWLQLPASQTEKFLLAFVVTQVLFFGVFLGCFYVNDLIFTSIYNRFHTIPPNEEPFDYHRYHADLFDLTSDGAKEFLSLYILLAPLSNLGALLFKKNVVVKTGLFVLAVIFTYLYCNVYMLKMLIPVKGVMPEGIFFSTGFRIDEKDKLPVFVDLPNNWQNILIWLLPAVMVSGLWLTGFYKLKEKQV